MINQMALISLFVPLVGAGLARIIGHRSSFIAQYIPIIGVLISWLFACALFRDVAMLNQPVDLYQFYWLNYQGYTLEFGLWLDALSLMMMVIVTSVSLLVHIYSLGYMQKEPGLHCYFAYVSFFTFAMLLLVMGNNLLIVFMGWEGVGVASYLLIGFWQTKAYPEKASIKAFVVNRIGDLGLLFAIGLMLKALGDISFGGVLDQVGKIGAQSYGVLTIPEWICFGLLLAAMGKSAQMPLQVWLPDSMAGPTPISALIHAATMVTAGIYLIARFAPWFEAVPYVGHWVTLIGFTTMILMGIVALLEYDIKRIVAYSTLSQLGMMIGVCGISGYGFSLFHLATHAAFKALLFLTAGAIITVRDHEQDIRNIGAMRSYPLIHLAMFIGLASMMAIPPLGGFFSKDSMLLFVKDPLMLTIMVLGATITALYSTRLYYWLFWQSYDAKPNHPVALSMKFSLIVLTFFSAYLGYMMVPFLPYLVGSLGIDPKASLVVIEKMSDTGAFIDHAFASMPLTLVLLSTSILFYIYWSHISKLTSLRERFALVVDWISSQYGLNPLYENSIVKIYSNTSHYFWQYIDRHLIDGAGVEGTARRIFNLSKPLGRMSDGKLYHYVTIMVIGLLVLLLGLL